MPEKYICHGTCKNITLQNWNVTGGETLRGSVIDHGTCSGGVSTVKRAVLRSTGVCGETARVVANENAGTAGRWGKIAPVSPTQTLPG